MTERIESFRDIKVYKLAASMAKVVKIDLPAPRKPGRIVGEGAAAVPALIEALRNEGHSISAGSAGENLTLAGLDWTRMTPGTKLRVGDAVRLEVLRYTSPCDHNACWFKDEDFSRISQKKHPGWSRVYARVLSEGIVKQGDPVTVES